MLSGCKTPANRNKIAGLPLSSKVAAGNGYKQAPRTGSDGCLVHDSPTAQSMKVSRVTRWSASAVYAGYNWLQGGFHISTWIGEVAQLVKAMGR